jgi:hypothetical protein
LTAEQISELKKALSEPIPVDEGYYRDWQIKRLFIIFWSSIFI